MSTSTVPGSVFPIISQKTLSPRFSVTAKLLAVSGLVLFGCALLVTFRVMVLNAHHELQHPGIDFAICSMTATVGLGITRIYQGRILRHRYYQRTERKPNKAPTRPNPGQDSACCVSN